ncbi:FHA domain-containing protein [bacterium]|nr:MAG: FHA domain-containing protein [bacterium]
MSATPIKICPLCGHANLAIASFCSQCDADLMNVSASLAHTGTTSPVEVAITKDEVAPVPPTPQVAGSDVETTRINTAGGTLILELVANPIVRFRVSPGQSVGRSANADVVLTGVPELEYISRAHARFSRRRAQWYVQYIAEGNSITVDGTESRDDAEVALYEGSVVVLSFTAFHVRLA